MLLLKYSIVLNKKCYPLRGNGGKYWHFYVIDYFANLNYYRINFLIFTYLIYIINNLFDAFLMHKLEFLLEALENANLAITQSNALVNVIGNELVAY
jgi:hypothetical protein